MIIFTKHENVKFDVLRRHEFVVSEKQVLKTVRNPDGIDRSRFPLIIAQRRIDKEHVIRVVYKKEGENTKVITFYPGRVKQYGK